MSPVNKGQWAIMTNEFKVRIIWNAIARSRHLNRNTIKKKIVVGRQPELEQELEELTGMQISIYTTDETTLDQLLQIIGVIYNEAMTAAANA